MLDPEHFSVIFGKHVVDKLRAARTVAKDDESLCAMQESEARKGFIGVEIVRSHNGYSVRYASGLQDWSILSSASSYAKAISYARAWVEEDPQHRFCYVRNNVAPALEDQLLARGWSICPRCDVLVNSVYGLDTYTEGMRLFVCSTCGHEYEWYAC